MTGYGRMEKGGFIVEIRSFNHRFLDISIRLPKNLAPLEIEVKKGIQQRFSRGRFEVSITREGKEGKRFLTLERELAYQYYKLLNDLKKELDLKGEVSLPLIASMKDLVAVAEIEDDPDVAWRDIEGVLHGSAVEVLRMRSEEGEILARDIIGRVDEIERRLERIKDKCPQVVQNYREQLSKRVKGIMGEMDERGLLFEVALFAERCDVTEEIVRAKSHISQIRKAIDAEEPVGKKIDFLLQEIVREVNTISSKANDAEISQEVVEIKGVLERVREQVQNIE